MDRLTSMGVFVKAADLGSFAAAAKALAISPQMVAKHVVFLEDRLGTALINRTTRRQSLTDIGRTYYDRCKLVLSEAEAADSCASDMHSQPKGTLRLNAPVTFGSFGLAPFITRFLTKHRDMQVDLTLTDRYVDPVEDGYEVIIRIGDVGDETLAARPLAPYRLVACASPAYIAARGLPTTPAELAVHDCLIFGSWTPTISCRWLFSHGSRSEEAAVRGRFRSNDWKALMQAALDGFGITLGPESVLASEIAAGRLVRVLPDYEGPARPMHVLTHAGRRPTAKVRSFVEALVAEFRCRS